VTVAPASRTQSVAGLVGFVAACLGVSTVGGMMTVPAMDAWYPALVKPFFTPPDGVFPPVWITLFTLMGFAAWRVWRRVGWVAAGPALTIFALQLALNLGWSFLFFGMRWIGAALVEIIVLRAAILWTLMRFARIDRIRAALLVPYLLWVAFAAVLTAAIWLDN
jgi:tryptophan-rich sensory protein